jgi:hypothetical protein
VLVGAVGIYGGKRHVLSTSDQPGDG